MNLFIALLRGVNVSGRNIIKMSDLKESLSSLGYQNIQTYIQSGNIIFASDSSNIEILQNQIKKLILRDFGYTIQVMVFTKNYFLRVFQNNPLIGITDIDYKKLCVTFLNISPDQNLLEEITHDFSEKIILDEKVLYLFYPNGIGRSKLNSNFIDKKLKTISTTRNWNTISKLSQKLLR